MVNAPVSGLLVFSQVAVTGWTVEVNGHRQEPVAYQDTFVAVELDAGSHLVRFEYEPPLFPWLLAVSTAMVVLLVGGIATTWRFSNDCVPRSH